MKKLCCNVRKGSAVFIVVIILSLVSSMLSLGMAKVSQVAMSSTDTNKVTLQAQQYAQSEADIVRNTNYSDLSSKSKSLISGTDFYRQVSVSAESTYDSKNNIKQKICTVNVYKGNESIPRSSLKVIRLNKGEIEVSSVPKGSILPWYGNLNSIPSGFALCNGQNGTPDLRNRFLVGAGNAYSLGATGGADWVTLTSGQMPSHAHSRGSMNITGYFPLDYLARGGDISANGAFYKTGITGASQSRSGAAWGDVTYVYFDASRSWTGTTSWEGGNQAHENRPPYYALYYIMKL